MHYQQDSGPNCTDRLPAFFVLHHAVLSQEQIRICKHPRGRLKVDSAMLLLVRAVLFIVPLEQHAVIRNV